jgi:hypothetical protein
MDAHSIRSGSADLVPSACWIDDPTEANRLRPRVDRVAALALINDLGIGNLAQWTG